MAFEYFEMHVFLYVCMCSLIKLYERVGIVNMTNLRSGDMAKKKRKKNQNFRFRIVIWHTFWKIDQI